MKFFARSIAALVVVLFLFESVSACTCREHGVPVCAEFDRADAVFYGKIDRITAYNSGDKDVSLPSVNSISTFKNSGLVWLHVKVEKAYKGVQEKIVRVAALQGTSCDIGRVKKGQRWIFFAYRDAESGNLGVGYCSGTGRLSGKFTENAGYFSELEKLGQGNSGTFIKGALVKNYFVDQRQTGTVSVEGENFYAENPTDKEGFFSFQVPKAGKYRVKVTVPFSAQLYFSAEFSGFNKNFPTEKETLFEYEIEAKENECNYYQIEVSRVDLKATAQISGKFVPSDWSFFPRFYPRLCNLKETEVETLKNCYTIYSLKPDGSFLVEGLREGKYTLVINEQNFPDGFNPFWRHYYPGVKDFKDARAINLEQGQKLSGVTFNLPPFLPRREIRGQVYWKDGTPVTFNPKTDNDLDIDLYSFEQPDKMIFLAEFLTNWYDEEKKPLEMTQVNPDGSFLITAFDGFTYWLQAEIDLPNGKTKCGFYKLTMAENTPQPIKVVLDRTDKCRTDDYVRELELKSK